MVSEKKAAYQRWLTTNEYDDWKCYRRCCYMVKKAVIKSKSKAWENKCEEVDRCMGGTKVEEAWKVVKSLRTNTSERSPISPINITTWRNYFQTLLTEDRVAYADAQFKNEMLPNRNSPRYSEDEVRRHIQNMKTGKSPGPGGLPVELLKYAPADVVSILTGIFNACLTSGEIPSEWKLAYITPIFKKGNKLDCSNYRGISVTSTVGRLYGRLLKERIEQSIVQAEEQSGFRAGRSCTDNIFSLKNLIEKRTARNLETHLVFVDLQKAYDSVPIKRLFEVLDNSNIDRDYVTAIRSFYREGCSRMKIKNQLSEAFTVSKGLRQGCCLSPTLFNIYIDAALKTWSKKCGGMGIPVGNRTLSTLLFADDQVVIAADVDDISYMTRKLEEEFGKWGLDINMRKTKYLAVGATAQNLMIGNNIIESCTEFKYLGVTFNQLGSSHDDITQKITMGKRAIQQLNPILWSKKVRKKTKKMLYSSIIESIGLYGAETWEVTEADKKKLQALQMDFLRRSCGISKFDHVRNDRIKEIMETDKTITDRIEEKQLVWYGHLQRMPEERWPKQIWEWSPRARRKRGRPRRTWSNNVALAMKAREMTEEDIWDRSKWRRGCEKRPQRM